jgi:hypothetical protein
MSWTTHESPFGPLTLVSGEAGLRALHFPERAPALDPADHDPDALRDVCEQLEQYLAGEREAFDVELDLSATRPDDPSFPATSPATSTPPRCGTGSSPPRRRWPTPAALPRPAPHVRLAGHQPGEHRAGPGVDGPRRREDHDALSAPQSQEDETELLADAFRPATGASAALTHVAPAAIASSATHRSATPIS